MVISDIPFYLLVPTIVWCPGDDESLRLKEQNTGEPAVSVVIPAYRASAFIHRAVRSVLAQTSGDFELVLVADDGEDYLAVLAGQGIVDHRIRAVLTGGCGTGPANARNVGLDAARGTVIATLDADDRFATDYLATLVPHARAHGAAYSRRRFIDMTTGAELENFDRRIPSGPTKLEEILTSQVHSYAGIVFDRSRVRARWPAWKHLWEDVYFHVRLFDDLRSVWHVDEPLYDYFRNPDSICNSPTAGDEHLNSARAIRALIDAGESIGIERAASRETYRRYLLSREALEEAFIDALTAGEIDDFHAFIRQNPRWFHSLEPMAAAWPD